VPGGSVRLLRCKSGQAAASSLHRNEQLRSGFERREHAIRIVLFRRLRRYVATLSEGELQRRTMEQQISL